MFGIIYIVINTINNKVYIGQTIQPLNKRWEGHCRKALNSTEANMAIKKAILKYGKENFIIKELEKCNLDKLDEREIYYIDLYDSYKNGYNSTLGGKKGSKGLKLSKEQQELCIELYNTGFSLRDVSKEFNVDKATVKHILEINNVHLRTTRTYKLSQLDREKIIKDSKILSRKDVIKKWNISKSYLSQLIKGERRI